MSKINKVLYNVDQRDSSKGEVNTREDMWMARHNIGLDEVVGQATVTEEGKEYTGIAPLGTNGLVPAEFLPSYVDAVVNGYYYNGEFYSDASHTQKITPDTHTTYVDITDSDTGISYRYTEGVGEGYYFQISNQNAFGRIAVGDSSIVTADRPMDTLKVVGDHWIGVTISDVDHIDTLTITHNNYVGSGTIGSKTDTEERNTLTIPWVDYDDQGHIVGTGTRTHRILDATTSAVGVVKLTSTYGDDETMAVTQKGVQQAIAQLDYGNKLVTGKFISTFSQVDGKIDYTVTNMDTTPTANSTNPVTSGGVRSAIDSLDATKTYSGTNFSVTVTETDGVITSVTGTDSTAANNHDHGSIANNGKVTVAGTTKKSLLITDNDNFVKTGPAFGNETGDSNLFLNKNGDWSNISERLAVPTFAKYTFSQDTDGNMYINTDILPNSYISSYLCGYISTLDTSVSNYKSIVCIPPHHKGSAHIIISGSFDEEVTGTTWTNIYLTDAMDTVPSTDTWISNSLYHGYCRWYGFTTDYHEASFIYRNDSDESKYITCYMNGPTGATYSFFKQFEMFPTI
jgi:hypothetical protein